MCWSFRKYKCLWCIGKKPGFKFLSYIKKKKKFYFFILGSLDDSFNPYMFILINLFTHKFHTFFIFIFNYYWESMLWLVYNKSGINDWSCECDIALITTCNITCERYIYIYIHTHTYIHCYLWVLWRVL